MNKCDVFCLSDKLLRLREVRSAGALEQLACTAKLLTLIARTGERHNHSAQCVICHLKSH